VRNSFNSDQIKGIANFFFDVAKGAVIASFGVSAAAVGLPLDLRLANFAGGMFLAYFCLKTALNLLERL